MIVVTKNKDIDTVALFQNNIKIKESVEVEETEEEDYIIVFEDLASNADFIPWIKSLSFLSKSKVYFIYQEKIEIALSIQSLVTCREVNYSAIDMALLEYILYKDEVSKTNISNITDTSVVTNIIEVSDANYLLNHVKDIKLIAINYLQQLEEIKQLVQRQEIANIEILNLKENIKKEIEEKEESRNGFNSLKGRFNSLSAKYKKCVYSEDYFKQFELTQYENAPKIIYFKVYEDMLHFTEFINTLKKAINLQLESPCKVLNLVNSAYGHKIKSFNSKDWYVANKSYNEKMVQTRDLIVKGGNYNELMNYLLTNELNLRYLIIIDNLNIEKDIILGKYFYFNICRNISNLDKYCLKPSTTIVSNNEDAPMSFNTLDYNAFKKADENTRYLMSSTQKAILEVLRTLETYK